MKQFAEMFVELDSTNKTNEKVVALARYFAVAPPADAAWALYFLLGRRPRQAVPARKLASWACDIAKIPEWLFNECYESVGDLAETIANILPAVTQTTEVPFAEWVENRLLPLKGAPETEQRQVMIDSWRVLNSNERFLWNKLITGSFRVGVAQGLVLRALSQVSNLEPDILAQRLTGDWQPSAAFFAKVVEPANAEQDAIRPYPFCLAHPLDREPQELGSPSEWQAEWKWDGIRSQYLVRDQNPVIWSRGEELITERFPELAKIAVHLPNGTLIDGEILPFQNGHVLPFAQLQKRIGRKTVSKKLLEEIPVVVMAYDLLMVSAEDWRGRELSERRAALMELSARLPLDVPLILSPVIDFADWESLAHTREESRARNVEGIMLKRLSSPYRTGRVRGDWWKWKIEPMTVDAVLVAAQTGSGKRANLFTDYSFGVWHEGKLVTFAKAYSGLTDEEIRKVDRFVRENTTGKFGPVRTVTPTLVFELGFEGIARSTRHKSGVAVRFPRILRWRDDKPAAEADTLANILTLLDSKPQPIE